MKYFLFFLSFSFLFGNEGDSAQKIRYHFIVGDYASAENACKEAIMVDPDSKALKNLFVSSLIENGKEEDALQLLKELPHDEFREALLESLCWKIIKQSDALSQPEVKIASLYSASRTQDARAAEMVKIELKSSNALVRATAAKIASEYRDAAIIQALVDQIEKEEVWYVRLEMIRALGRTGGGNAEHLLNKLLSSKRITLEEKGSLIGSLATLQESINVEHFRELIESNRASLRHFACQIALHLDLRERATLLFPLLKDPSPEVRMAALTALYLLGFQTLDSLRMEKLTEMMEDSSPSIAITAAWAFSSLAPERSKELLLKWIFSSDQASRRLAAQALGRLGRRGKELSEMVMRVTTDPFVQANIALGAIGQGGSYELESERLYHFLTLKEEKLRWDETQSPLFQLIAPATSSVRSDIMRNSGMEDCEVRLEILAILTTLNHPKAESGIRSFLKHHRLGIPFLASNILLREGGEKAQGILTSLLQDEHPLIRIQAALALALNGQDPQAFKILEEEYPRANRELKVHILGAMGYVGGRASIPFLTQQLEEPHQILKMVAASALIQCLYH